MSNSTIEVQDFRKEYGDFVAVNNISFDVKIGEILAYWGQMVQEKLPRWKVWKGCVRQMVES